MQQKARLPPSLHLPHCCFLKPNQPCSTPWQEDFLACKRQRMEGWLQTAGLVLKTIAVESGLLDASGAAACLTISCLSC